MANPISRHRSLVTLAGIAAVATLPAETSAQSAPALNVGLIPIWDTAPFYAAQEQGYFAAENIAPVSQVIRGGAAAIPALAAGSLDICYSNGTSIAEAIARGIDLRIIMEGTPAGTAPPDPGALLKRKGDPLKTGKDMEGKIIAVNALHDVQWMFVMTWVKKTGGDPSKVQIVELAFPAMVEAIKAHRVDAAFVLDPFFTAGLADPGIELLDWVLYKVNPNGPVAFFAITPQTAATRANDVRAFIRAYKRGVTWMNANTGKDAFYDLIAGYTGLKQDIVKKMVAVPAHADITPNTLGQLTSLMLQWGLLASAVDLRTKIWA